MQSPTNQRSEQIKREFAFERHIQDCGRISGRSAEQSLATPAEWNAHAAEMLQSPLVQDGTGPAAPRRYLVLIVILAVLAIALCGLLSEWLAAGGRLR